MAQLPRLRVLGGDLSFAQARKLVKLLPSVLRTFLRPEVIKRGYLAKLQHCVFSAGKGKPPKREDDWPSAQPEVGNVTEAAALEAILQAYLSFGASLSAVFQKTAHPGLRSTIVKGRKALLKVVYFDFSERPNVHIWLHLNQDACLHGTATQTEVSVKEMAQVHRRRRQPPGDCPRDAPPRECRAGPQICPPWGS